MNHSDFIKLVSENKILIGIDATLARSFFTQTNSDFLKKEIVDSLIFQRILVGIGFVE